MQKKSNLSTNNATLQMVRVLTGTQFSREGLRLEVRK